MQGLTTAQAKKLQAKFGKNELTPQKKQSFLLKALRIIAEPMFLLLIIAATIYFILGEPRDGAIMLIFVIGIISIDIVQEWKTDKTLSALKDLSAPHITVLRDGKEKTIMSADLVPGDVMLLYEGVKIPADGVIIKSSDLSVDESSLTGEAEAVWKIAAASTKPTRDLWRKDYCYAGTLVIQGSAMVRVDKIGLGTQYGKIGANVATAPAYKTPLQKQTGSLIKLWSGIAAVLFALVSGVTFLRLSDHAFQPRIISSILAGITLAMAMIPEEFPVILTVFLSLGAWRLAKKKSLVRNLQSVETLGAVSVLCVDKTGTITMNQMTVQETWASFGDEKALCEIMGLACETDTYDPMEKAMLEHCAKLGFSAKQLFSGELVKEYSFTNELKMMAHVWQRGGNITIAAKGSPEKILTLCKLTAAQRKQAKAKVHEMSRQGLRVIAVASGSVKKEADLRKNLTDYSSLTFQGLIGLVDPPRATVKRDIAVCNKAGIRVVMITGDNGVTASSIAQKVGILNSENFMTGDMLDKLSDKELSQQIESISIFSRVTPEHKMRIVKAFKANGEVVAMTGDGVNDAPALKYADIGIAMGKRGSEVSREAADLILMDDNFSTIVYTIADGRRIYDNIRKAVGYVVTIHIPIALASLLAPVLGINPTALLLLPVHVVLLELIIDPTCSIVLERQPAEADIMSRPPRNPKESLFSAGSLIKSLAQGLIIFGASFGIYFIMLPHGATVARSMGLSVVMLSSLFLVLVNSSHRDYAFRSIKNLAHDKIMWVAAIGTLVMLAVILYTPLNGFLRLAALPAPQLLITIGTAAAAVFWYEIVKIVKHLI